MKKNELLLGIDIGTSSIKVALVDAVTRRCITSASAPVTQERAIIAPHPNWAEQAPQQWWNDVVAAVRSTIEKTKTPSDRIVAIGITYQMHGLVVTDKNQTPLRNAIIWCDSRTESQAKQAVKTIGAKQCRERLLNFPGHFTASKLAWVKENEPDLYARIDKLLLPGDYIALQLTGEITSTIPMLSEGIFWDFKNKELSGDVLTSFGFPSSFFSDIRPVFAEHGRVTATAAKTLNIPEGIPVTYKAGDQPNNALSLNVLEPGEIAATAGTSGVIYAVTDKLITDQLSRINTFAHVNHTHEKNRLGLLLCINGAGISNRWIRDLIGKAHPYEHMNQQAAQINIGADDLLFLPFGNGEERMLNGRQTGGVFSSVNLNRHRDAHCYRAVQEGIAMAFRYGVDIMRENGTDMNVIKAGKANMFLSDPFIEAFVNLTGLTLERYQTDGSIGAALGAGIGLGIYQNERAAFANAAPPEVFQPHPQTQEKYERIYIQWKKLLEQHLA